MSDTTTAAEESREMTKGEFFETVREQGVTLDGSFYATTGTGSNTRYHQYSADVVGGLDAIREDGEIVAQVVANHEEAIEEDLNKADLEEVYDKVTDGLGVIGWEGELGRNDDDTEDDEANEADDDSSTGPEIEARVESTDDLGYEAQKEAAEEEFEESDADLDWSEYADGCLRDIGYHDLCQVGTAIDVTFPAGPDTDDVVETLTEAGVYPAPVGSGADLLWEDEDGNVRDAQSPEFVHEDGEWVEDDEWEPPKGYKESSGSDAEWPSKTVVYGLVRGNPITDEDVDRLSEALNEAGYSTEYKNKEDGRDKYVIERKENFGEDE